MESFEIITLFSVVHLPTSPEVTITNMQIKLFVLLTYAILQIILFNVTYTSPLTHVNLHRRIFKSHPIYLCFGRSSFISQICFESFYLKPLFPHFRMF